MTPECIRRIWARRSGGTSEGVTGLVVQGGAMRGIYSMAALMSLEECGLGAAFDHVLGASAGAINGAYMLAGNARRAVTIFLDDINNRKFINFLRPGKIADIDYVVDCVLKHRKKLDIEKVRAAGGTLHVALTDAETAEAAFITSKDKDIDLMEVMRATAALPVLYGRTVTLRDREYMDGGVACSLPLLKALELGCTDILVVLTMPPDFRYLPPGFLARCFTAPFMRSLSSPVRDMLWAGDEVFNDAMELLSDSPCLGQDARIAVIHASDPDKLVGSLTTSRDRLLTCALMGCNDTRSLFGLEPLRELGI